MSSLEAKFDFHFSLTFVRVLDLVMGNKDFNNPVIADAQDLSEMEVKLSTYSGIY